MSQYTYVVDYTWILSPEGVTRLVEDEEFETLTNAEQIISIAWDQKADAYLVCWRVRKWIGGGDGT